MLLPLPCHWGFDHLIVDSTRWRRDGEAHFLQRRYEVLDLWHATRALERIAREDERFFRQLADTLLGPSYDFSPPSGSYQQFGRDQQRLAELKRELGTGLSRPGEPPHFATFYICRRKLEVRPPPPDPWKGVRQTIEAAKHAPRGYVTVETVNDAGDPVPSLRLEILLADGELLTRSTDASGRLRVEPIPQGSCHIRVPGLDGSAWSPAEGAAASCVDRGPKRARAVRRGEGLSRIAKDYGMQGWKQLWDDPDNEALRAKRKHPNLIRPGDEVVVPQIEVFEIVRPTDQTHRIIVARTRAVVALLNTHMLEDPGSVTTHWHDGSSQVSAATSFYQDDTSLSARLNELFDQTALALVASPGSGQPESGPSSADADVSPARG